MNDEWTAEEKAEFARADALDGIDPGQDFPVGWEETGATVEGEEAELPFATAQLAAASDLLVRAQNEQPSLSEVMEAQALALTSIAATVHDMFVLLGEELEYRRQQRNPGAATEEAGSAEEESAHRSEGSEVGSESFPFAQ